MRQLNQSESLRLFIEFAQREVEAADVDPAVAYLRYMCDRMEMNRDQVIWLCFLYGVTYHLPSAYLIWNEFPDLELADSDRLVRWWNRNSSRVPFQTDKRKCKRYLVETVMSYQSVVGPSQSEYLDHLLTGTPAENFDIMWSPLRSVYGFGRFSTWNQCQVLKHVAGYNIEPSTLMLGEPDSISFTDGLAYAFGYPERVTRRERVPGSRRTVRVPYRWSEMEKAEMEGACHTLKSMLRLDNFQLETIACAFKKIWRTNDSRYTGYYNDRMAEDIHALEAAGWDGVNWQLLWDARDECVPASYLHGNHGIDRERFRWEPIQKIRC